MEQFNRFQIDCNINITHKHIHRTSIISNYIINNIYIYLIYIKYINYIILSIIFDIINNTVIIMQKIILIIHFNT